MNFQDNFLTGIDLNFEISKRKTLNLNVIKRKVQELDLGKFAIDISINGYSSKSDFDFVIDGEHWSDKREHFKVGEDAKNDPEALTVKRAMRVCAELTTAYIEKHNVTTSLCPYRDEELEVKYCHLASMYNVIESQAIALYSTWTAFDSAKKTNIADSVLRILTLRFPELDFEEDE